MSFHLFINFSVASLETVYTRSENTIYMNMDMSVCFTCAVWSEYVQFDRQTHCACPPDLLSYTQSCFICPKTGFLASVMFTKENEDNSGMGFEDNSGLNFLFYILLSMDRNSPRNPSLPYQTLEMHDNCSWNARRFVNITAQQNRIIVGSVLFQRFGLVWFLAIRLR